MAREQRAARRRRRLAQASEEHPDGVGLRPDVITDANEHPASCEGASLEAKNLTAFVHHGSAQMQFAEVRCLHEQRALAAAGDVEQFIRRGLEVALLDHQRHPVADAQVRFQRSRQLHEVTGIVVVAAVVGGGRGSDHAPGARAHHVPAEELLHGRVLQLMHGVGEPLRHGHDVAEAGLATAEGHHAAGAAVAEHVPEASDAPGAAGTARVSRRQPLLQVGEAQLDGSAAAKGSLHHLAQRAHLLGLVFERRLDVLAARVHLLLQRRPDGAQRLADACGVLIAQDDRQARAAGPARQSARRQRQLPIRHGARAALSPLGAALCVAAAILPRSRHARRASAGHNRHRKDVGATISRLEAAVQRHGQIPGLVRNCRCHSVAPVAGIEAELLQRRAARGDVGQHVVEAYQDLARSRGSHDEESVVARTAMLILPKMQQLWKKTKAQASKAEPRE